MQLVSSTLYSYTPTLTFKSGELETSVIGSRNIVCQGQGDANARRLAPALGGGFSWYSHEMAFSLASLKSLLLVVALLIDSPMSLTIVCYHQQFVSFSPISHHLSCTFHC